MKLGLDIGYSGARMAVPLQKILLAEDLGFDVVWASEAYGSDAMSPLAYLAGLTKRIRLGTGIAQLAARTPANCAMTAQTIDALAGEGRMILGIGVSGPQIVEGWYGQPWGKPPERIRDYVAIMKKVWRREEPVVHDGPAFQLPYQGPGSSGLGKPLKSILHGNPDIPVLIGAATPGNVRLTGEIADGWLSMHVTPRELPANLARLAEGLARRTDGKAIRDLEIVGMPGLAITEDVQGAIDKAKPATALYVGGMGAQGKNYHKDAMVARGYATAADRIEELFRAGRKDEAAAAVPDEYIDEAGLIGPEARVRERLRLWADAGFTAVRFHNPDEDSIRTLAQIARQEGLI